MTEFLKQDIFFFVATIGMVVVTILIVIALFYLLRILRNAGDISDIAKDETHKIVKDVNDFRDGVKTRISGASNSISFLKSFFTLDTKKSRGLKEKK